MSPLQERHEAVSAALVQYGPALRAFVAARAPATDVDDIVQAAASRAIERAGSLRDPARVRAWLFRVVRNTTTDTLRHRARRAKWVDAEAPAEPRSEPAEAAICACGVAQVNALSPRYAEILELVDLGESALPEAARRLGITTNNATVRLHRARRALRKQMREHCGVTSFRDCQTCRCIHDGCCAA